jgi:hypothetical protein
LVQHLGILGYKTLSYIPIYSVCLNGVSNVVFSRRSGVFSLLELLYAQLARTRPATSLHQSSWLTIYFARVANDTTPNQFESTRVYSAARSQERVLLHIREERSRVASSISRARIRSLSFSANYSYATPIIF